MADILDRLRQSSAKNRALLNILAETDHAAPSLEQQRRLIADLKAQLADSDRRVKHADQKRKAELHDHERYRTSVMRRFAYKATGKKEKFAAKAEKEEQEYFTALQNEHREQKVNANLREQLAAAEGVASQLEAEVARHTNAQQELDTLYNALFGGETPAFPHEDELERAAGSAAQAYQNVRGRAEAEGMAVRLLGEAQRHMAGAWGAMQEAQSASRVDMFGGGTMADAMERSALQRAESRVMAARMAVLQARHMSPLVADLPAVDINHGHIMRDIFFDNIFTDMAFHDEIKRSTASVGRAAAALERIAADAQTRSRDLEAELRTKEEAVREARMALQREREAAFQTVASRA